MHNKKYMIVDQRTVLTGNFNYTGNAEEENDENLIVIGGRPKTATAYGDDFAAMLKNAERCKRKE